ncbi:MAG: PAS domain-containing protein [Candidatus Thorarchaeota archaeon]|nr:PAS domain-containing protein [Candidatus Thorarchaeota archaeon]
MIELTEIISRAVDIMNVGIILVDNDNQIVLHNKIAGEMFQLIPEERIGTSILRCHAEESVLKMIEKLRNGVIEKHEDWTNFKGRMMYMYTYPVRDDEGNYVGLVEDLHDAAEKAEHLKSKGMLEKVHVSGYDKKVPRNPK